MSLLGGIIGAGANLLGGIVGAGEQEDQIDESHWQFQENMRRQEEFAKHGIQWRVQDAKDAGLHPLFALGGNVPSFSPVSGMQFAGSPMGEALSRAGQDVSRAIAAQQTPEQKQVLASSLMVNEARAANDFAQASYWTAKAAELGTPSSAGIPSSQVVQGGLIPGQEGAGHMFGVTERKASPVYSRDPHAAQVAAGSSPFWRSFQLRAQDYYGRGKDLMIDLPYSEEGPSESMQDLPVWMYPEVVRHNMERYGGDWMVDFLKAYPESPIAKWLGSKTQHQGSREFEANPSNSLGF